MSKTTEQLDFEAMRDGWIWESETGSGDKRYWPFSIQLSILKHFCAFCHYFKKPCSVKSSSDSLNIPSCYDCPKQSPCCNNCYLAKQGIGCYLKNSPYEQWVKAITKKTCKKYALIMANACIQYCKERWG